MLDSFNWILPDRLAGSGLPGLMGDLDADLEWIRAAGIRHVISLTASALAEALRFDLVVHHFPVSDMGIPVPRKAMEICRIVLTAIERGEPVLVHCKAGLGRTGTILACCLVSLGWPAEEAVSHLRRINGYYVQTRTQETFVQHYADFLNDLAAAKELAPPFRAA